MKKRRLLSALLSLAMAATMLPAVAVAADTSGGGAVTLADTENDDLVLNKTAKLEDDGTYTINLDAYAKGEVKTVTSVATVPTDVILVLDQSGSMEENNVVGIPSNTYSVVSGITNTDINSGSYYYKAADGAYYKVTATKELVSSSLQYEGDDGKTYKADQLSNSWKRKSDGQIYNTARPFVTSSLSTWTRNHRGNLIQRFWYKNDGNGDESSKQLSAKDARSSFENSYGQNGNTVEFHNDGAPAAGDTAADDPYYCAAVYIAVTLKETNMYRYTYTYTDASGKTVTIGTSETDTETTVDNAEPSTTLYKANSTTGTRLKALQYAANEFVDNIHENAVSNNVDHRVAVVGFASDDKDGNGYYYMNSELFIGADQYNYAKDGLESTYNTTGNLAADKYSSAFQSVKSATGYQNAQASVNALAGKGGTHPELGFAMANGIFKANPATYTQSDGTEGTRNRIVIFLTDGEPGTSGYDANVAQKALDHINVTKNTYHATIYTVAVLDGEPSGNNAENVKKFLQDSSSSGEYTLATDAATLKDFFEKIESSITDTTSNVTLTANAAVIDKLSDYFDLPDDFDVNKNVTVQTAKHLGYDSFATPTAATGITVAMTEDNRGISVRGFDFSDKDNWVTTDVSSGGSTIATGYKLVVTITGLLAKDSAATGTYIDTNGDHSGIWDIAENGSRAQIKAFPKPKTLLDKKLFVLDYAKNAELDVYDATKVDSAGDKQFSKVSNASTDLTGSYGKIKSSDGLVYTPTTTKWDGFDTFYALGKDADKGDRQTQNIWSRVSVIPANNVYYEDTFVTNKEDGTVGIVYTGGWETETAPGSNTETANGDEQGWETSLSDDTDYSDGTAASVNTKGATATFTFTGRGVDIYSRTNMVTGLVRAQLYKGEETTAATMTKSLIVDNLAQSGDYYQIPTVSFSNLEYGTYTVKLTVGTSTTAATGSERSTYYLDGIRVYNPLSDETEQNDDVTEAYDDEIGATFQSVRNMLLDAKSFDEQPEEDGNDTVTGAVFIDYIPGTGTGGTATTANIGTYTNYGPKNEVYLAKGQAIAFRVPDTVHLAVGLKAPEKDKTTTAEVTDGVQKKTLNINTSSDLYYEITPNENGYVVIKNTGENLLSVTKIKTSGEAAEAGSDTFAVSRARLMSYANEFDSLPVVEETPTTPENPEVTTPDEGGDVVIDNPEETAPEETNPVANWISNLFGGIKKLFGR